MATQSLASPLRDVWRAVGTPAQWRALGGARAECTLHVYGMDGRLLGKRMVVHDADLTRAWHDRIAFDAGRRIHARHDRGEDSVWTQRQGIARSDPAAAGQLDVFGLLLRSPWQFADERFEVEPAERAEVDGDVRVVVRIRERTAAGGAEGAQFELLCAPDTMLPVELRFRRGPRASWRNVRFAQYQRLGDTRFPVRRLLVDPQGSPLLEIEVTRLQSRLELPVGHFAQPGGV